MRILIMPEFKPGDLPPEGYLQWHEWAEVQRKAGIKQVECGLCGLWKTPQELSDKTTTFRPRNNRGELLEITQPVCTTCTNKEQPK